MNYVFFGTPEFAAIILEKIIAAGLVPQAVVCNPDRPKGRKKVITPPPVKRLIANGKWHIEVLQPEMPATISHKLSAFKPDFFLVVAYSKIIPKEIFSLPHLGTIGVHPSLLPKYRGPTPIQTAILNGDEKTGVTLFQMDERVDHGPIIATSDWPLATSDNYENLLKKLAELAGELLIETLPKFIKGEIKIVLQNENEASYTKKLTIQDGFVDLKILRRAQDGDDIHAAQNIERKIRALNPEPGVWTLKDNKRVKLLSAEIKDSKLKLKIIQKEGNKPTAVN